MSDDLVERLMEHDEANLELFHLAEEAADEIKELRAKNSRLIETIETLTEIRREQNDDG